ncbi:DUF669 domain-containing protein [Rhizobium rhizogenes]|uniref:DUF669 domain-containing protein n=1 Tax=Rhizobium rhizogenes TaxID=359 RepID=UPI0015738CE7|nr:DUF669 domain-containing protein [Rhizobium rhizogenes]NTF69410.1 DUF669 domain-containing protein [Rhizobium rhizogenes]
MARLGASVVVTEEATKQPEYGNVPNGIYELEVTASDVIQKNENTPQHSITVKVTIDVRLPEEYRGRKIFANYNIQHPNSQTQEIGNRQFQALLAALKIYELGEDADTQELHLIPFVARIGMGKDSKEKNADGSPQYAARNEIKTYYFPEDPSGKPMPEPAIDANQPAVRAAPANDNKPAPAQQRQAAPAAAAATPGRRPWGSK